MHGKGPSSEPISPTEKPSATEFILSTYNPRVAVLSTPSAESVAKKNNLTISQLLSPFSHLTVDVLWHEPVSGQTISPKSFRISPVELSNWKKSDLDSPLVKKSLANVVAKHPPTGPQLEAAKLGSELNNEVDGTQPWFNLWRRQFLKQYNDSQNGQYDYLHHFIACIFFMTASDAEESGNLTEVISHLSKLQNQHQTEWPGLWAFSPVLKFYIIIHETDKVEHQRAESIYLGLRTTYGGNFCHMVEVSGVLENSDQSRLNTVAWVEDFELQEEEKENDFADNNHLAENLVSPDVQHPLSPDASIDLLIQDFQNHNGERAKCQNKSRGIHLSVSDTSSIQAAMNDFMSKALLPFIDRQARNLHDLIVSRRGMSKSFFSATKRLFSSSAKSASSVVYSNESVEMMSRKLADIYFLFCHYGGAYQLYHQLKKDFLGDSAWPYYASCLEMAAVSHFMMSQTQPPLALSRAFPAHYITEAITCYIENCRLMDSAMKCALICSECLKHLNNFGEAASILTRMTSEESDFKSGLMLEQAAYCFKNVKLLRKYALNCVLAGHRFSKAGLKSHSLYCYLRADLCYYGKGWKFAEDHIRFSIARHLNALNMAADAPNYLAPLLKTPSPQPTHQIQTFYKEYLHAVARSTVDRPLFFVPKLLSNSIIVRTGTGPLEIGELNSEVTTEMINYDLWDNLEETAVKEISDTAMIMFKPSRMTFNRFTDNSSKPSVPCNETFYVDIPFENVLSIPVFMRNIRLHFSGPQNVISSVLEELNLQPLEIKWVRFSATAVTPGSYCYDCMEYDIEFSPTVVPFKQKINIIGPRISSKKAGRGGEMYAKDYRNCIQVNEAMPLLHVNQPRLPETLLHSQLIPFNVELSDSSTDPSQINRIEQIVLTANDMNKYIEVSEFPNIISKSNSMVILQPKFLNQKFCIPCVLKIPEQVERFCMRILVTYRFSTQVDSHKQKNYRISKLVIDLPVTSCVKLDYSVLKLLTSNSHLGVLRSSNLTMDGEITLQVLNNDKLAKVEILNHSKNEENPKTNCCFIKLNPMDSTNVLLKLSGQDHNVCQLQTLDVSWSLLKPEQPELAGVCRIPCTSLKALQEAKVNNFVLELRHNSQLENNFISSPGFEFKVNLLVHSRVEGRCAVELERNMQSNLGTTLRSLSSVIEIIGQTKWVLDVIPGNVYTVVYSLLIRRPGVFNVGPKVTISMLDGNSESISTSIYSLNSPLIANHITQ